MLVEGGMKHRLEEVVTEKKLLLGGTVTRMIPHQEETKKEKKRHQGETKIGKKRHQEEAIEKILHPKEGEVGKTPHQLEDVMILHLEDMDKTAQQLEGVTEKILHEVEGVAGKILQL